MDSTRLVTLYDLLQRGHTVAQLATAIERHGIAGWDRFGRYSAKTSNKNSEMAQDALAALAAFWKYQIAFEAEVEAELSASAELDIGRAIEDFGEWPEVPIHHFGWSQEQLPDIGSVAACPKPPRLGVDSPTFRHSTLLHIIGALLDFIESRGRAPSQAQVVDTILARHPTLSGAKRSTLEGCFAEANEALGRTPKQSKSK